MKQSAVREIRVAPGSQRMRRYCSPRYLEFGPSRLSRRETSTFGMLETAGAMHTSREIAIEDTIARVRVNMPAAASFS